MPTFNLKFVNKQTNKSSHRCTSVLSDDSELSTLCDEEPLGTGKVDYGCDEEEVRPELLSSSEDSSPEADLPFSKKFLNVFVNSTSRSSSKSNTRAVQIPQPTKQSTKYVLVIRDGMEICIFTLLWVRVRKGD